MPFKSRLKLPPIDLGEETIGERIRRLRKRCGLTQVQLAKKMGLIQNLISDYERGLLRLRAEMVARFAKALEVSCDEVIGFGKSAAPVPEAMKNDISLALMRQMSRIHKLPPTQRRTIIKTIGMLIKGVEG